MTNPKAQKSAPSTIKNIINKQKEMENSINALMKNQIYLSNQLSDVIEFLSSDDDDEECDCESCGCDCEGNVEDDKDDEIPKPN